ncbi:MAG TPA: M15 family metallopeptidase [Chryseolinea sp.]|nr:M15 family metallopeptidase [Chryseolinea sp.]
MTSISTYAQLSESFAPYDCRLHAEFFYDEPVVEIVQIDSSTLIPELVINIDTINGWKNWSLVDNFSFGKNRGTMPMIADVDALNPYFRDKVLELIKQCKLKGIELAIVETYRTHAKQHEYKTMGKKYTSSSAGRSKHQYGLAIDVVPVVDSIAVWDNAALWKKIGTTGERLGLRWGGRWKKPFDPGHFEWTGGLTSAHLGTGKLPSIPSSDNDYPCIEEDIKLLRKYWKEWEVSQSSLTRK